MYRYGILFVLLNFSHNVFGSSSKEHLSVEKLLELGRDFLSAGKYQDALMYFHEAVVEDPKNYLTYYKRGTVYLALGKARNALADLDKVIELKPDFDAARIQRGNLLLKLAELDKAEADFLASSKDNEEVKTGFEKIINVRNDINTAESYYEMGDYETASSVITHALEICPWSSYLRKLRAKCRIQMHDYAGAVSDMKSTIKLTSDNTEGLFELSSLLYQLGEVQDALKEIRECLRLDPEHKDCFPFYKKIKKVAKVIEDSEKAEELKINDKCIQSSEKILKLEPAIENVKFIAYQRLCRCYTSNSQPDLAIKNCHEAVKIQRDPETLCDSAEAHLEAELYDDAIREYKEALEIESSHHRAKEGIQKAQQRQKQSESRDYYKILGVPRNAKKQEIVKAYRKAAQKWHPDNFQEGEEKKRAEKKFIDIAAAKEVLTDEEKRSKFDRGEDPLDPESGKHGPGFNPFQEFHHFHGQPFQFKFSFN